MQKDVKVFIPEMLADIFPGLTVKGRPDPCSAIYSINVSVINGEDLIKLVTVYLECNVDIVLRRYGKGITVKVAWYEDGRPNVLKVLPLEKVS